MKKIHSIILLLAASSLLFSCKSSISIQVLKPAEVTLPNSIKKVAIINRSLPEKGKKFANVLDGILSGEELGADKEGSYECVIGLNHDLKRTEIFEPVNPTDIKLYGTGTGSYPTPLFWDEVGEICKRYEVDALVLLETFDSRSRVRTKAVDRVVKDKNGKEFTITEYFARMELDVKAGWRIYDPETAIILDTYEVVNELEWEAQGDSEYTARGGLISKRDAIKEMGYDVGRIYGTRITPNWITVIRSYYTGKGDDLKMAAKHVRKNEWEEAKVIWTALSEGADLKIAGRACYNLALAAEMEGDLDLALQWANKSANDFQMKDGAKYVNILTQRTLDQDALQYQLDGKEY